MTRCIGSVLSALLLTAALAGASVAQTPTTARPAVDVVISPGDVVAITVVGQPELSSRVTVTADGKIPVAFAGEVTVAGMKPAAAAEVVRRALSEYVREPVVTIDLIEANRASIYGRVMRPGTYVLPSQARAMDLVQIAGGFEEAADRARIRLLRQGVSTELDLARFTATGDPALNPELRPGDMLTVPERATVPVSVLGQVMRPGSYAAPVDATVMDAVQMAGGFGERADRDRVTVLRGGQPIIINLANPRPGAEAGTLTKLQANDVVTVPGKRLLTITVLGQVARPSVYEMPEGATVAEAVTLAGGLSEGADPATARLVRRGQAETPLDLREALEDASATANVTLQDGDVISIPKPVVERRIGVLGAVRAGGYFLIDRDRVTIMEALSRAGGPTADADLAHAVLVRREGELVVRVPVNLKTMLKGDRQTEVVTMGPGDVLYLEPKEEGIVNRRNMLGWIGALTSLILILGR
ncbi:MAG: SLBB domain-containing protein [Armatimonadetes bacterium]|nr:SLBB domain-containing protein [Armatimonadota bacterium]